MHSIWSEASRSPSLGSGLPAPIYCASTDEVTVADSLGDADAVNFFCNEAGTGPKITPQDTTGKDAIFGTRYGAVLTGGGADQFVFAPNSGPSTAQHPIEDFVAGLDKIVVRQISGISAPTLPTETRQGNDTLITLDSHDSRLLKNVAPASLSANDFIPHPGNRA
jgi:hypothetical protein